MARRKYPDYTVSVVSATTPEEGIVRFTRGVADFYFSLSEERREFLCKKRPHDLEEKAV